MTDGDRCGYCGQGITPEALAFLKAHEPEPDDDDDHGWDDDEDSHVIGERRIEYVDPTWRRIYGEDDAELSKCACCNRFFVQAVPIRLFHDLGDQVVLGFEVCEQCAPKVIGRMYQSTAKRRTRS